ncbi:MAG: hypothetical protein ACJ74G_16010 [Blastocatellia bacterium]
MLLNHLIMSTLAVTTVLEARATANDWLFSHLPDRFAAGIPEYNQTLSGWCVPVWLSYPLLEPLGPVGKLVIDESSGIVREHTSIDEMKNCALGLYEQHREQIEAAIP